MIKPGNQLSKTLITLKVMRSRCRQHTIKDAPYNAFCDAACDLYRLLDLLSIEELEKVTINTKRK